VAVCPHADRYIAGTLQEFDTETLYRAGKAGVFPALKVHETTKDESLKNEIARYLRGHSGRFGDSHSISLEMHLAWTRLESEGIYPLMPLPHR